MNTNIRWESVPGPGLEHLRLGTRGGNIVADSVVLGTTLEGAPFRCQYTMHLDSKWRLSMLDLRDDDRNLVLRSERGGFCDAHGEVVAALEGCVDVDLSATPFTNTLPLRRLGLARGESRELLVAYVAVPGFRVQAVRQRYTRLGPRRDRGQVYRYESLASGVVTEILVDGEGLVVEYPSLFRRLH